MIQGHAKFLIAAVIMVGSVEMVAAGSRDEEWIKTTDLGKSETVSL